MCIDEKCYMYQGYIYVCVCVCVCSRMKLIVQVVLLCALTKNYLRTQYICSRMQLTGTSFSYVH